jgi:hypothetical protein
MTSILETLQSLLTRVPGKKEHVPLLKNEKEVLRLRLLKQTLRG